MNKNDITNVNNLQLNNTLNINNRQIKYLQDGNENNDAVYVKQLNELESTLENFYSSEIAKVNIYFFTNKPVYSTYSESTPFKKFVFISLTSYKWSGSSYFTLNSDSITILKSGVYYFYYADTIRPILRGNNTSGYLEAYNYTDAFRKNKYSNFIQDNVQGEVILDFTTYISANDKVKIRGVDVKRFDSTPNHSNVDKDTFLLIRKLF